MNCKCDDRSHTTATALWHRAYCNWYDSDQSGQRVRAALWGFTADRLARHA